MLDCSLVSSRHPENRPKNENRCINRYDPFRTFWLRGNAQQSFLIAASIKTLICQAFLIRGNFKPRLQHCKRNF